VKGSHDLHFELCDTLNISGNRNIFNEHLNLLTWTSHAIASGLEASSRRIARRNHTLSAVSSLFGCTERKRQPLMPLAGIQSLVALPTRTLHNADVQPTMTCHIKHTRAEQRSNHSRQNGFYGA